MFKVENLFLIISGTEVTYTLKSEYTHYYENIINDLENNTSTIGFNNHGLIATTLEDVFMSWVWI